MRRKDIDPRKPQHNIPDVELRSRTKRRFPRGSARFFGVFVAVAGAASPALATKNFDPQANAEQKGLTGADVVLCRRLQLGQSAVKKDGSRVSLIYDHSARYTIGNSTVTEAIEQTDFEVTGDRDFDCQAEASRVRIDTSVIKKTPEGLKQYGKTISTPVDNEPIIGNSLPAVKKGQWFVLKNMFIKARLPARLTREEVQNGSYGIKLDIVAEGPRFADVNPNTAELSSSPTTLPHKSLPIEWLTNKTKR